MTIDDRIAELHVLEIAAIDAAHSGEEAWYSFQIRRLEDLRDSPAWSAHRRQLTKDLNYCVYGGDIDGAAVVQAAIERWERGQP